MHPSAGKLKTGHMQWVSVLCWVWFMSQVTHIPINTHISRLPYRDKHTQAATHSRKQRCRESSPPRLAHNTPSTFSGP
ncbi:hypothetical protein K439DRAFT_1642641 [Ramaria rubella]|nr:hypothetical protein K439DRAFT_1642641 [Ramaria rubella]